MEQASSGLSVDWHLLVLQIVNFCLILGILTWLVWRPLIEMIDKRRTAIAEGLAAAKAQKEAAEQAARQHEKLLKEAREEAAKVVAQTREELAAEQARVKEELTAERARLTKAMSAQLEGERAKIETELRGSMASLVTQALASILVDQKDSAQTLKPAIDKALKELK